MSEMIGLFRRMIDQGASDVHLVIGRPPLFRQRGELVPQGTEALTPDSCRQLLFEILTEDQRQVVHENLDLDFAYELPDGAARFRCNVLWQHRGLGGVMRVIPSKILTIEQLGLPPVVTRIAENPRGLILVTGPTGSGKSTTLAAIINHINEIREAHILTIEDPLEFVHPCKKSIIVQREVGTHTASFASALKMAAREDPDVILVGEMRDLETIRLALTAAELGVAVFATLHTNSAAKTIDRIIDAFPSDEQGQVRTMLADSLKAVIAQQLVKTADGAGRCAANEVLIATSALANLIREGKIGMINSNIQTGGALGMQTMDQALMRYADEKRITLQAAYEKAIDKEIFVKRMRELNQPLPS
ncbi:MAG: type IV pilus twitching motility protein PilT [Myxococcales bacterium]